MCVLNWKGISHRLTCSFYDFPVLSVHLDTWSLVTMKSYGVIYYFI
jgi:hypothetical protein